MEALNNQLTELLDTIDIEYYLDREGITYRRTRGSSGEQLNLKSCPVCGGDKWKVYLNADTGLGNCFSGSCEARFNKYSFIKANVGSETKTSDVIRYIKLIASEQGWRPKKRERAIVDDISVNVLKLPDSVEIPFQGKNIKYLAERGISKEIASYFYLRYSKNGHFQYTHDGTERRQDYSSRVVIPIYDLEGTLVSFQGRDMTGTSEKKYLFPPGFASTGKYLYNGHNAVGAKRIVICEGVFDVMATKIALDEEIGLREVVPVGSFGKHLSNGLENDQIGQLIKLKERGLKEVTFMWDGEAKAISAAIKSALVTNRIGLISKVATLPKGKDPNEATIVEVINAYINAETITKLSAMRMISELSQY